jgi:hypothetical protein
VIVSQARWTINAPVPVGNKPLRRLKDYSISDESDLEAVNEVGSEDPVGFRDKPGARVVTFNEHVPQGRPEVDWFALKRGKVPFSLTQQYVGGDRVQFFPCRVAQVGKSGDDEGSHMREIKIVALKEERL